MKKVGVICIILIFMIAGCGVRIPKNYATEVIDKAVDTNEMLIRKIENAEDYTDGMRANSYKSIIEQDNRTLRAVAETIRKGGGS